MTTAPRRVLLVSPEFHGYLHSVAGALRRRGHQVISYAYDAPAQWGRFTHARVRLKKALGRDGDVVRRLAIDVAATAAIHEVQPDALVIIRGDALGSQFWEVIDDKAIPRVLWLFDNLARMTYEVDSLMHRGPIASFSHHDTDILAGRGVDVRYLPNGFDERLRFTARPTHELVFIGEQYPNRADLLEQLGSRGIAVCAYGRTWSRSHLGVRVPSTRAQYRRGPQVSRAFGYGLMAAAPATLNIHGPPCEYGDGLSTRTFEACGVGGIQFVDRPDVAEFYDVGTELEVFTSVEQLVELIARAHHDPRWASAMRRSARARTLADHSYYRRAQTLEEAWESWR